MTTRTRTIFVSSALLASCWGEAAWAQNIPVPPPRPPDLADPRPAPAAPAKPARASSEKPSVDEPSSTGNSCHAELHRLGLVFDRAAPPPAANVGCGIEDPIRLRSLTQAARADAVITFPDQPVVACRFAQVFASWIRDLVVPVVAGHLATEVKTVRTGPGFACRNQNRSPSGKLSAHATGIAIDIADLELASGEAMTIRRTENKRHGAVLAAIRTAACGWFTTILGPGSDAYHADHIHLDIQPHGSSDRYRICQ